MTDDPKLFKRLRDARKAGTFTNHMFADLMDACHRPLAAARIRENAEEPMAMKLTGLEYFIRAAQAARAGRIPALKDFAHHTRDGFRP